MSLYIKYRLFRKYSMTVQNNIIFIAVKFVNFLLENKTYHVVDAVQNPCRPDLANKTGISRTHTLRDCHHAPPLLGQHCHWHCLELSKHRDTQTPPSEPLSLILFCLRTPEIVSSLAWVGARRNSDMLCNTMLCGGDL